MVYSLVFYNAILLLSTLFVWLSEKASTANQRKFCSIIAFLIVFLPSALRYEIGIDYFSYKIIFENIRDGLDPFLQSKIEPGYYFLNWLVAKAGFSYELIVAICSFLVFYFFFKSYPHKNKYILHFVLISLLFFTANNLLRSWIALSIAWYGVSVYLREKNTLQFAFILFVSSLFHKSAILLFVLLMPFINVWAFIRYKYIFIVIITVTVSFLFFFGESFFRSLLEGEVVKALGYSHYATSWYSKDTEIGSGLGVVFFTIFLIAGLYVVDTKDKKTNKILYVSIFIAIFVQVAASHIHILGRLKYVFFYSYFVVLFILLQREFLWRLLAYVFILISFYNFNNSILKGSTDYMETCRGARIVPYVSVFNKSSSSREPYLTSRYNWCDAYFENK